MKRAARWFGALLLGLGALWWFLPRGQRPPLGAHDGHLEECPDSPNCACSQSTDPRHRVDPLAFRGAVAGAQRRLRALLDADPEMRFIEERDGYLRYEAVTRVWRFVDDVELLFDPTGPAIQMRSASRIGRSDLGTNRRRLEQIRAAWTASGG